MNIDLQRILASIRWYIEEHNLSSDQIRDIFNEGLAACCQKGTLPLSVCMGDNPFLFQPTLQYNRDGQSGTINPKLDYGG